MPGVELAQRRGEDSTCSGTRSSEVSRASHACPQHAPMTHLRGSLLTCAHARTVGAPVACRHDHVQLLGREGLSVPAGMGEQADEGLWARVAF